MMKYCKPTKMNDEMTYKEAVALADYWSRRKEFYEKITGKEYTRTYEEDRPILLQSDYVKMIRKIARKGVQK